MRKSLIGIMVLAVVALISGTALAATFWSVDVTGKIDFLILDQSGLKLTPTWRTTESGITVPSLTFAAGPWEATMSSIKYTADPGSITLQKEVWSDIYGLGGTGVGGDGVVVAGSVAPLSLNAAYLNVDAVTPKWAIGIEYVAGTATLGAAYNNSEAYGVKLGVNVAPLSVTLKAAKKATDTAYGFEATAALAAAKLSLGYDVTFEYYTDWGVDGIYVGENGKVYNTPGDIPAGVDYYEAVAKKWPTTVSEPLKKLIAKVADLPLTAMTKVSIEVVSQNVEDRSYGKGITITGTALTALVAGVDLTTELKSIPAGGFEYEVRLGVSF